MTTNPNDSAFTPNEAAISREYFRGLTKREYMATAIFASLITTDLSLLGMDSVAEASVKRADALIRALNEA